MIKNNGLTDKSELQSSHVKWGNSNSLPLLNYCKNHLKLNYGFETWDGFAKRF